MGFRDAIKKGGGFLNNVDGALVGYEFTNKFKGETKPGEWVYFVPQIHVDGADDPIDQHLFIGSAERYSISDDGQELSMADGGEVRWGYSTPFGRITDTLATGFEKLGENLDELLPDPAQGTVSFAAIVDRRFRFKQEVDEEGTKKFGKRVVGAGKNKREYDRTNTVIDAVLGASSNGNGNGKVTAGKKVAKGGDDEAIAILTDILSKGAVNRKNLSLPVTKALMKNANKDVLKKTILDEDWQDAQDFIEVDKKGNLSLTE